MNSLLTSRGKKPRRGVVKNCAYCGIEVYRQPCYANSKLTFCTHQHSILHSKQNASSFNCTVCGKKVLATPSQMRLRNRRSCSHKCNAVIRRAEAEVRRVTYTKHQLDRLARYSPEAATWRKAIFERDDYRCVMCGARNGEGKNVRLEADHIKPWAYFPGLRYELSNGRTLCRPCHDTTKMSSKAMRELYNPQ